jgi:hypothetical protein
MLSLLAMTWQTSVRLAPQCQHLLLYCFLVYAFVLLLKSDILDAQVRERSASLPLFTTTRFLLEPKDDVPEEISVLDLWGIGKTACVVGDGGL